MQPSNNDIKMCEKENLYTENILENVMLSRFACVDLVEYWDLLINCAGLRSLGALKITSFLAGIL